MSYRMSIAELLSIINVKPEPAIAELVVSGMTLDSRLVGDGTLFCAYPGGQFDGRNFIEQALQAGATAVLCEAKDYSLPASLANKPLILIENLQQVVGALAAQFYAQPSSDLQVFGITGTNGKTTCCYLLTQALALLGKKTAMIGTIGAGPLDALDYAKDQATTT